MYLLFSISLQCILYFHKCKTWKSLGRLNHKVRKGKEEYLYNAIYTMHSLKALSFTCKLHIACLSFVSVHQMAPPLTVVAENDIRLQLTTHLLTRRDERLSWAGWLTYSGRFTHMNGHPSATGLAQDRDSLPAKDRHSTVVPRNQPKVYMSCV